MRELLPWDILDRRVHEIRMILGNVAAQNKPAAAKIVPLVTPIVGERSFREKGSLCGNGCGAILSEALQLVCHPPSYMVVEELEEVRFIVVVANHSAHAISILEERQDIHLVFIDIDMPSLEWFEAGHWG